MVRLCIKSDDSPGQVTDPGYLLELPEMYRPVEDVTFVGSGSISGRDINLTKYKLLKSGRLENGTITHATVMYQAVMTMSEFDDYYVC
jgi:hypothetical protein